MATKRGRLPISSSKTRIARPSPRGSPSYPPRNDEEFFSLATRLEVLEIAVDVVKARMMAAGLGEVAFSGDDYES